VSCKVLASEIGCPTSQWTGDPLLTTLETTIYSVLPVTKASNAKKGASSKVPILELVLQDTILFPEGGGQPYDTGRIVINGNEEWIVQQVDRRGGYAIHTVHHREGATLPEVGAKVTVRLDEDRRWDLVSGYC
jgi:misacylated tRNA(Ala) deacylase